MVPQPLADNVPGAPAVIDWDATLAYRHELWSYGLGVADAMDTAQRGMGLDWPATQELIKRSAAEAASVGGAIACGAGTDQLDLAAVPAGRAGLTAMIDAYREQIDVVGGAGAKVILMASRALAARRAVGRRLPRGLRHAARRGGPPGHPALAGHHVRPGPGRLLGQRRRWTRRPRRSSR